MKGQPRYVTWNGVLYWWDRVPSGLLLTPKSGPSWLVTGYFLESEIQHGRLPQRVEVGL